ncbi:hypothetical protein F4780DRAFT_200263 [Xylariomycetidae sp. FL0641]|nr:hypothetical protein F4780DRAFT_200263 [Xylariomycetidae sp. FL0641]
MKWMVNRYPSIRCANPAICIIGLVAAVPVPQTQNASSSPSVYYLSLLLRSTTSVHYCLTRRWPSESGTYLGRLDGPGQSRCIRTLSNRRCILILHRAGGGGWWWSPEQAEEERTLATLYLL